MAEQEQKLGPNITYTNPDKTAKLMSVSGVLLKEGESVNLVERLGAERAEPILRKLAKNRYFKVDGGPDHSQEQVQESPQRDTETLVNQAVAQEARIRREQGDEAADRYVQSLDQAGQVREQESQRQQANYQAPEQPTLEQPAQRRRSRDE